MEQWIQATLHVDQVRGEQWVQATLHVDQVRGEQWIQATLHVDQVRGGEGLGGGCSGGAVSVCGGGIGVGGGACVCRVGVAGFYYSCSCAMLCCSLLHPPPLPAGLQVRLLNIEVRFSKYVAHPIFIPVYVFTRKIRQQKIRTFVSG